MSTRRIVQFVLAVGVVGCSSSSVTTSDGPVVLTGSYAGFQEGTIGNVAFDEDPFEMTLIHEDDSVRGSWIATIGGVGTVTGVVLPSDSIFEFTLEMVQTEPCPGTFVGVAEARAGIFGNGQSTIGIVGSYAGDDCDNTIDAAFFVQRLN